LDGKPVLGEPALEELGELPVERLPERAQNPGLGVLVGPVALGLLGREPGRLPMDVEEQPAGREDVDDEKNEEDLPPQQQREDTSLPISSCIWRRGRKGEMTMNPTMPAITTMSTGSKTCTRVETRASTSVSWLSAIFMSIRSSSPVSSPTST